MAQDARSHYRSYLIPPTLLGNTGRAGTGTGRQLLRSRPSTPNQGPHAAGPLGFRRWSLDGCGDGRLPLRGHGGSGPWSGAPDDPPRIVRRRASASGLSHRGVSLPCARRRGRVPRRLSGPAWMHLGVGTGERVDTHIRKARAGTRLPVFPVPPRAGDRMHRRRGGHLEGIAIKCSRLLTSAGLCGVVA